VGSQNRLADVGDSQVRHTRYAHGRLMIQPEDNDEQIFILAVGTLPRYRVVGWLRGGEAKQPHWWTTQINGAPLPNPCWAVPQPALCPMPPVLVSRWRARDRQASVVRLGDAPSTPNPPELGRAS
jgi:hypothetical protein